MHIGCFDRRKIRVEHLCHGGAGDINALLGQAALVEVLPGVLGIGQIHVGDDVHNPAVGLLRQALVLAAVARLHVEDGNVQPLGGNGGQAGIGVPQNQHGVGFDLGHELIGAVDNVAHGGAQIVAHRVHIHLRVF